MIVGGYPLVFHELQALAQLNTGNKYCVKNVYLHGKYPVDDIAPFLDSVITKFDFNIVYLLDDSEVE